MSFTTTEIVEDKPIVSVFFDVIISRRMNVQQVAI